MLEPMKKETKKHLEKERSELKLALNSIQKRLKEWNQTVSNLRQTKEELERRINSIDEIFSEYKTVEKARW